VETFLGLLFWTSLFCIVYSYMGYPAIVALWTKLRRRSAASHHTLPITSVESLPLTWPHITVLIAAHNAENHIGNRIQNILESDFPSERMTIVVASDGSSDRTVEVVQEMNLPNVQAIKFHQRRGKSVTLGEAIKRLQTEIVVLTDATNRFDPLALKHLVRHFRDPNVGLATGKVSMIDEQGAPAESFYWRSELKIRHSEAQLGIMLGASGALYAIRRPLFVEPSRPVINDDLVVPLLMHLRHRCRFVFDESAIAYAVSSGGLLSEFRRRCRIGAGAFQSLPILGELLRPGNRKQAWAFASHKLIRWLCPFLLLACLACNIALMNNPIYHSLFVLQSGCYLLALLGLIIPRRGKFSRIAGAATSFVVMNLALLTGFFRWIFDPGNVVWSPTPRPSLGIHATLSRKF
jgi:cellulose synthase/poly-beta-1,6-N-acetylglucosamine synthase-like glycosyltransferase